MKRNHYIGGILAMLVSILLICVFLHFHSIEKSAQQKIYLPLHFSDGEENSWKLYCFEPGKEPECLGELEGEEKLVVQAQDGMFYWLGVEKEETPEGMVSVAKGLWRCHPQGEAEFLADDRGKEWQFYFPVRLQFVGKDVFLATRENGADDNTYFRYAKWDSSDDTLELTNMHGSEIFSWSSSCIDLLDRAKLIQEGNNYYYYSSVEVPDGEGREMAVGYYDSVSGEEIVYSVRELLEKAMGQELPALTYPASEDLLLRMCLDESSVYLDIHTDARWQAFQVSFSGKEYRIKQDEAYPGGDWRRVVVTERKIIYESSSEWGLLLELDRKTGDTVEFRLPEETTGKWQFVASEAGYVLWKKNENTGYQFFVRWYEMGTKPNTTWESYFII